MVRWYFCLLILAFLSQGQPIVNTGITLVFVFDAGKTKAKNYMQDPQRTHLPVLPAAWWVLSWSGSIIFEKTIGKFWVRHLSKIRCKTTNRFLRSKSLLLFCSPFFFQEVSITVFFEILSIHSFTHISHEFNSFHSFMAIIISRVRLRWVKKNKHCFHLHNLFSCGPLPSLWGWGAQHLGTTCETPADKVNWISLRNADSATAPNSQRIPII